MDMKSMYTTNWIWVPGWDAACAEETRLVYFRKRFVLEDLPEKCVVKVSADSRYKLYVNGFFISEGPSKGDLETWYADTLDLTDYLVTGENVIAAEVIRIPEAASKRNMSLYRTPTPCFYIADQTMEGLAKGLSLNGKEGFKCKVINGVSFRSEEHMPAPIKLLEDVKADSFLQGFKYAGYDDSEWDEACGYNYLTDVNLAESPFNLVDRTIPLMEHNNRQFVEAVCARAEDETVIDRDLSQWNELIAGRGKVVIPANSHEIVELSAGELTCGYINYGFEGGSGSVIKTTVAECYSIQQEPRMSPRGPMKQSPLKGDRTDFTAGTLNGVYDTYLTGGFGSETCPEEYTPFWFRTFRYIQLDITTGDEPLVINRFDYTETAYPLKVRTGLKTSDPTFEGIWDISVRTLKRCMHETYFDCPFYEQLQYGQDSRSEILFTYAISADDRLARRCMDDFKRSRRSDGLINACAPTTNANVIPGFSIYYILMIHDHMMYFADKSLVKYHISAIDDVLNFFDSHIAENGMVGKIGGPIKRDKYWSFIDWSNIWGSNSGVPNASVKGTGQLTAESLLYVIGLEAAADLNRFLDRCDTADEYLKRADSVKRAVVNNCIGEFNGINLIQDGPGIDDYSVHCQVLSVLCNITDNKEFSDLLCGRDMLGTTVGNMELAQASVSFQFYLFRALERVDWYEKMNDLWDLWRNMLKKHLTTCVENDTDERSDCHAWAAPILYELPAIYAGVRPEEPGVFKKHEMKLGHLTDIRGEVITPDGVVVI